MKPLDITEVAKRSGLPASALRFYEEKRLIASTGRRGLRRVRGYRGPGEAGSAAKTRKDEQIAASIVS